MNGRLRCCQKNKGRKNRPSEGKPQLWLCFQEGDYLSVTDTAKVSL